MEKKLLACTLQKKILACTLHGCGLKKTTKIEEHGQHAGQDDESKEKAAQHSTISKSKHST